MVKMQADDPPQNKTVHWTSENKIQTFSELYKLKK